MSKNFRWFFFLLLLAVAGTAWIWHRRSPGNNTNVQNKGGNQPITVTATKVTAQNIPIWLTGIGTVQAYNTVTVRPRVSGNLEQIQFVEGSMVKQGDVLAQIDQRPYQSVLDQALARKAQNEAQLVNARQELARVQNLVKSKAVSKQSLDEAEAAVAQLEAAVQADNAAIAAAQLDLDFTTVRAPIAGRTGIRQLDVGNIVTANQEQGVVTLTQLQPISVVFTLPQNHLPSLRGHLQSGAEPLIVQAHSEDGAALLDEGTLELIDNQIDSSTGTLRLKAVFKNEKLNLWPGQFITARILVETRKNVTVVPPESIKPGLNGPYAYLIRPDKSVEARNVKTGISIDGWTIIEEGLNPGDQIVLEGHIKLKPGSVVSVKEEASS